MPGNKAGHDDGKCQAKKRHMWLRRLSVGNRTDTNRLRSYCQKRILKFPDGSWQGFWVAEYMAYTVGPDGYQIALKSLHCADDVEAADKARRLVTEQAIELWCGHRFVIRFDRESAVTPRG